MQKTVYNSQKLVLERDILSTPGYLELGVRLDEYVNKFQIGAPGSYGWLGKAVIDSERTVKRNNNQFVGLFNKYLLVSLLADFDVQRSRIKLTNSVQKLYIFELDRIGDQLDVFNLEFYQFKNDSFLKDLSILSFWLIPVGAEYVVPYAGVPRSLLFKKGVLQLFQGIWTCLVRAGGFKPYFELHAHPLSLDEFNPEGWLKTYANLAGLLEENPQFLGVTSSSWFLDPALKNISPHLSYLREVPKDNGATIFFNCWDSEGVSGALSTSNTRRCLFKSGGYRPAIYSRVWPRNSLISFKERLLKGDKV